MSCIRTALPIKSAYSKQMFLHLFSFFFTSIWSERYSIGFKCFCITRVSDHLKNPTEKNDFTNLKHRLNHFAALLSAWLNFLMIFFSSLLYMALCFCLFNFISLLKKKKIHSSCFSSHFVSVFLPCGCVAQAGTSGNCPKGRTTE